MYLGKKFENSAFKILGKMARTREALRIYKYNICYTKQPYTMLCYHLMKTPYQFLNAQKG